MRDKVPTGECSVLIDKRYIATKAKTIFLIEVFNPMILKIGVPMLQSDRNSIQFLLSSIAYAE